MIRVEIHDDWNDPHGGGIDHRVVIETDAGYNPDVVQDMARRAVEPHPETHPRPGGLSVTDNLTDAIAAQLGVPMVTRWVLVAEVIEEDGEPTLHSLSSPGLPLWSRYGLLSWGAQGCVPQPTWTEPMGDE